MRRLLAVGAVVAAAPALAAPNPSATEAKPPPAVSGDLFGDYLAGRHAEKLRDYPAAVAWFDKAIAADPQSPELISRTFLMAVGAGDFDLARKLAGEELKLDPNDALARLIQLIEKLKAGDPAGAAAIAAAL
ncbi:MAG: hypothetical protein JO258_12105, partial [Alphaproteobacteria bacterium]|nr:hypothetical protein [Alphaproteobacteria bacterium]